MRDKAVLKALILLMMVKSTQLFLEGLEQLINSSGGQDGSEASTKHFNLRYRSGTDCNTVHPKCLSMA